MATLVFYGQNNLQKSSTTNVTQLPSRNAAGLDLETIDPSRANGTRITNIRRGAKVIPMVGNLVVDTNSATYGNLQSLIREFDSYFSNETLEFLRIIPEYYDVAPGQFADDTNWTTGSDTVNLAVSNDKYQFGGSSIGFDIDVSNSGNDYAELTLSGYTQYDLSGISNDDSINFTVYVPDVSEITSIDLRIGNDSSNYYSANFIGNYQGGFSNGENVLHSLWSDFSETGTVNLAQVDYVYVRINYSSSMTDQTGCYLDQLIHIIESRTENYECVRTDQIGRDGNSYNITFDGYEMEFLVPRGFSQSLDEYNVLSQTGITALSTDFKIDFEGSINQLPVIDITVTDSTNLDTITFQNLLTNESVILNPATIDDGDTITLDAFDVDVTNSGSRIDFTGIIPKFKVGVNDIRVSGQSTGNSTISQETFTKFYSNQGAGVVDLRAQSFTADLTGTLTSVEIFAKSDRFSGTGQPLYIYSDSAGEPDTLLASTTILPTTTESWLPGAFSLSVTDTNVYWIVFPAEWTSAFVNSNYWGANESGGYAGGSRSASVDDGATWINVSGEDHMFRLTIEPTPSFEYDIDINYKKLHLA